MSRFLLSTLSRTASRASIARPSPLAVSSRCIASPSTTPRRGIHVSAARRAEEAPTMPLESQIMNLLSNNQEFKDITFAFAGRLQKLFNIDVQAGQMPGPKDMMTMTQDPELRDLSIRMTKILSDSNVNLSPATLQHLWEMLSTGRKA